MIYTTLVLQHTIQDIIFNQARAICPAQAARPLHDHKSTLLGSINLSNDSVQLGPACRYQGPTCYNNEIVPATPHSPLGGHFES